MDRLRDFQLGTGNEIKNDTALFSPNLVEFGSSLSEE